MKYRVVVKQNVGQHACTLPPPVLSSRMLMFDLNIQKICNVHGCGNIDGQMLKLLSRANVLLQLPENVYVKSVKHCASTRMRAVLYNWLK